MGSYFDLMARFFDSDGGRRVLPDMTAGEKVAFVEEMAALDVRLTQNPHDMKAIRRFREMVVHLQLALERAGVDMSAAYSLEEERLTRQSS